MIKVNLKFIGIFVVLFPMVTFGALATPKASIDNDGDGYFADGRGEHRDCNDNDSNINPGSGYCKRGRTSLPSASASSSELETVEGFTTEGTEEEEEIIQFDSPTLSLGWTRDYEDRTITFIAYASDDSAINQVEFSVVDTAGVVISVGVDSDNLDGWSIIWDTTATTDGLYEVFATATYTDGSQISTENMSVYVGYFPEILILGFPSACSYGDEMCFIIGSNYDLAGGNFLLTAMMIDFTDSRTLLQVEFQVDGVTLGIDSNSADGWSMPIDLESLADGVYVITAIGTLDNGDTITSEARLYKN